MIEWRKFKHIRDAKKNSDESFSIDSSCAEDESNNENIKQGQLEKLNFNIKSVMLDSIDNEGISDN